MSLNLFGNRLQALWINICICLIFQGSVFLTSRKFNNEVNSIKFYYTVIFTLAVVLVLVLGKRNFRLKALDNLSKIEKSLFAIGLLQAIFGLLQFFGVFSSNNISFKITGSFDNPAGFVSVISMLYPIGLFWIIKTKRFERLIFLVSALILLISIVASGSRTGLLAVLTSSTIITILESKKLKQLLRYKIIYFFVIPVLLVGLFFLYRCKKDSVDGRILIWKVSANMIKEKPLFGFGVKGFHANYMYYQADYFRQFPESKYTYLADNVLHPFNEFIKITVNYGLVGLFVFLIILGLILKTILYTPIRNMSVYLGIFATLIVLSSFSYPLFYTPVWFLIIYYVVLLYVDRLSIIKLSTLSKSFIFGICVLFLSLFMFKMWKEIRWKEISEKSQRGRTLEMLPNYENLYPSMKKNALFLYNYGAELNYVRKYKESIIIMNECCKKLNDYDVQMIMADNYYHLNKIPEALAAYELAANMIPCRFLPLYFQLVVFKNSGDSENSKRVALEIIGKKIKIKSSVVEDIIKAAESYLKESD